MTQQDRGIKNFYNHDDQPLRLDESVLRTCLQRLALVAHGTQHKQIDAHNEGQQDKADISQQQVMDAFDPLFETVARKDLFDYRKIRELTRRAYNLDKDRLTHVNQVLDCTANVSQHRSRIIVICFRRSRPWSERDRLENREN